MIKKYFWLKILILAGGLFLCGFLFLVNRFRIDAVEYMDKGVVYSYEMKDFLKIADLDGDEAEKVVLPKISDTLTEQDEKVIYEMLGFSSLLEERENSGEYLSRKQWCADYEAVIKALGKKEVKTTTVQYLGHVPGEERIITDQGNFNTYIPEEFWIYGAYYEVYCCENEMYGVKAEDLEKDTEQTAAVQEKNTKESSKANDEDKNKDDKISLPKKMRVLLTNDNKKEPCRKTFEIVCKSACTLQAGDLKKTYQSNKTFTEKNIKDLFGEGVKSVTLTPEKNKTLYIKYADSKKWSDSYRGTITIYKNKSGYWLVNTVALEEYLYGVVPGEMPQSFHMEALKAQAVCARTFACNAVSAKKYSGFHADVDDSVNSQVYNKNGENKKTTQAVNETKGKVLGTADHNYAGIYYYSTSCGFTTGLEAWGEKEGKDYLKSVSTLEKGYNVKNWDKFLKQTDLKAYDSHSRYFRWKADITLPEGYSLKLVKREKSGVVTDISYVKNKKERHVKTENNIRQDLGKYLVKLTDAKGKSDTSVNMLPSAFFTVEKGRKKGSYILYGGGYGHGIGMSQYGADGMALKDMKYDEILEHYFPGTSLM